MEQIEAAENEGMTLRKTMQPLPEPTQTNHEELMELLGAIFVQLSRIYDTQMLLLSDATREAVDLTHQRGELMGSPPTLKEDAWD